MEQTPKITAVKGFNADWTCRGFQYEVGKTYRIEGPVSLCEHGFHACLNAIDVWTYYGPAGSRFGEVELGGDTARHSESNGDSKIAATEITINAELKLPEVIRRAAEWIVAAAKANTATGDGGHAAATGYRGHAAATGDSGHAAATGSYGHAAVKGKNAIAAALGIEGTAVAEEGGAIMLAAYDPDNAWTLAAVFASKVGENGIEAGKRYRLGLDGKPIEVS
jgi:hypothetical protein